LLELSLRLPPAAACAVRVQRVRARLAAIRLRYSTEISAALGARVSGARTQRRDWQNYLAFLHEQYAGQNPLPVLDTPASGPLKDGEQSLVRQAERDEWTDGDLPPRTVLLTFDDGPHPVHTPKILDILARYQIKAVFFQVGQNIGTPDGAGGAVLREPQIIARMLADGHTLANHTHSHPLLPKLDAVKVSEEIDRTEALISAALRGGTGGAGGVSGERSALFRPPYGARNDLVLAELSGRGLRSVLWNIDSRDWADPLARSVAQRVIDETLREERGIVLFHDIHARAVDALPTVIEELQKRGFKFARFEQGRLVSGD
jgi:peptidoglycan/xylan/chitin deacetylase (PgdA/CDA1 family)